MVETKNGETFNGTLKGVDGHMNIRLENVIQTNKDATRFHKIKELFIRGNCLKYFRMNEEVLSGLEGSQYVMPRWYNQNDKGRKKHHRR
jgi:U6 snRNA-associated Sm-like protein LSm4